MFRPRILVLILVGLLAGGVASAQVARPLVFASGQSSTPSDSLVSQIGVVDLELNSSTLLFEGETPNSFEDVVVGPGPATDGGSSPPLYVYACDPTSGLIIRFDPSWVSEGPLGIDDVEIVYQAGLDGGSGNILSPQCGSFTNKGDLIFTDRDGLGAWICEGLGFEQDPVAAGTLDDPLCQIAGDVVDNLSPLVTFDFPGAGITQAANGDALAVDTNMGDPQGRILRFAIDGPTATFPNQDPTPLDLVDELGSQLFLDNPLGIARLSNGEIFVAGGVAADGPGGETGLTGGYAVNRFVGRILENGMKQWELECQIVLEDDCGQAESYFLEAGADDTIYVAASYHDCDCTGSIWKIPADPTPQPPGDDPDDPFCTAQKVFGYDPEDAPDSVEFDWLPETLVGLGVSPTATEPDGPIGPGPDFFIDFNDHVYEISLSDLECSLETPLAHELPKSCLDGVLASYPQDDPENPGEPKYVFYDPDDDGEPNEFVASPVLFLGEDANGIAYHFEGECTGEGEITHAVSAFTQTNNNPRIVRCDVEDPCNLPAPDPDNLPCEVIELDSFFPGAGVLPEDGRISGTTSSSDFSYYFVVEAGPGGYQPFSDPATAGESCGFFPPFRGIDELDCFHCGPPKFFAGIPVTALFRAKRQGGHCLWGPFVSNTTFLASVARVRDENGNHVFQEMDLHCLSPGCDERPLFRRPPVPWLPYLIRFSTRGWEPGFYQIVATDLDGGVPSFYDYFEIVDW